MPPRRHVSRARASHLRLAVVHGPNLDLLGEREPEIYGTTSLADIDTELRRLADKAGAELSCFQSNHEGELIDHLHALRGGCDGLLVNAAGLTHTSVVLRDALVALDAPFVEVHLSNIYAREPFRRHSLLSDVAIGVVSGFGALSYALGLQALLAYIAKVRQKH